ncbi:hypothetical protein LSAT2_020358, partial [Lamellibrachia satsuma]
MSQLKVLSVSSCSLTDQPWSQIVGGISQGCRQLKTLICSWNEMTDAGSTETFKTLLAQLPKLVIWAHGCGLSRPVKNNLCVESDRRF